MRGVDLSACREVSTSSLGVARVAHRVAWIARAILYGLFLITTYTRINSDSTFSAMPNMSVFPDAV